MHWRCTANLAGESTVFPVGNGIFWVCPNCIHDCIWFLTLWHERAGVLPLSSPRNTLGASPLSVWTSVLCHHWLQHVTGSDVLASPGKIQPEGGNSLEKNLCCMWSSTLCGFRQHDCSEQVLLAHPRSKVIDNGDILRSTTLLLTICDKFTAVFPQYTRTSSGKMHLV